MKISQSTSHLISLTALLGTSLAAVAAPKAADEKLSWGQWLNKIASGVSMEIYNSPKLDGTVAEISKLLAASTDVLEKLGLSGPRTENRKAGVCPRMYHYTFELPH